MTLAIFAIVLSLLSSLFALGSTRLPKLIYHLSCPLLMISGTMGAVAGILAIVSQTPESMTLSWGLPWLHWRFLLDPLSGFFFFIISLILIPVGLYSRNYIKEFEGGSGSLAPLGFFTGIFIASMLMVTIAADTFSFMFAWEVMSVSSYFLVVYDHEQSSNRRAAFLYLTMAQLSGLFILLSFSILSGMGNGFGFDAMRQVTLTPFWAGTAFALAFIGFGMKAGLLPVHVWLPEAHPVAPSHVSALMSGVMLKVAVYGFIRVIFDLIHQPQAIWGVVVLLVGSLSAFMGILLALMQNDLKKLLAYSSVENIGIIFIGLGLSIIFTTHNLPQLSTIAFIAALFHVLNHAVYKSLLFMGAGAVLHSTHEKDLDKMGALIRTMPWTALFFLVGVLSISALPPLNGFVSEWLSFRAFLEAWQLQGGILKSVVPLSAAILAITGALAAACFVKVFGIGFLGQHRTKAARKAKEVSFEMRIAMGFLALLCILLGVFAGPVILLLNHVSMNVLGTELANIASQGIFQLTPLKSNVASYNPGLIALGFLVLPLGIWLILRLFKVKTRRADPWDCGFAPPSSRMQYTSVSYSQPFRRIFSLLFHVEEKILDSEDKRRYSVIVSDRFWGWIYLPIAKLIQYASRKVSKVQSGNIRGYLAWSLFTLIILLWLVS